jgi:hypothetical protein
MSQSQPKVVFDAEMLAACESSCFSRGLRRSLNPIQPFFLLDDPCISLSRLVTVISLWFFIKSFRGCKISDSRGTKRPSCVPMPMNLLTSVTIVGAGIRFMASTLLLSGRIPFSSSSCPRNITLFYISNELQTAKKLTFTYIRLMPLYRSDVATVTRVTGDLPYEIQFEAGTSKSPVHVQQLRQTRRKSIPR